MRKKNDIQYHGICIDAIRKSYKEGETIKLIRTERDGSQGVFEKITENWVIEKKYKYFATCIRKVRNGVIRQSFLWTDIQGGTVV